MAPLSIILFLCSALSMASNDPQARLDIHKWIIQQDAGNPVDLPEREIVGKVISCIGKCQVYRGSAPHSARWLSQIMEGDEVHTAVGSYLWIQLIDGTLVRLSPEGELSLLEVNLSKDRIFFQARLARGQLYWLPRSGNQLVPTEASETDRIFLPVMDIEANLESFRREQYAKLSESQKAAMLESPVPQGLANQYQELNRLIVENNKFREKMNHEALIVVPNVTLHITNQATHIFHVPVGKTFIKFDPRTGSEVGDPKLPSTNKVSLRGYTNIEEETLGEGWWRINDTGREIHPEKFLSTMLNTSELLIRRIPTLILVREREIAKHKSFWLSSKPSVSEAQGYRFWSETILNDHLRYLKEHTRRLETTNLRSISRLLGRPTYDYDERFFSHALETYFNHLKRQHSHVQTSVLDMSPLHYYGWMLINARQN